MLRGSRETCTVHSPAGNQMHVNRRQRLALALCLALVFAAGGPLVDLRAGPVSVRSVRSGTWSDPSIWSAGSIPSAGAIVLIANHTTVEYDMLSEQEFAAVDISGVLTFSRSRSTRLDVGNIFVRDGGVLDMGTTARAIPPTVAAEIRFVVPREARFVGGEFVASDVGLWVFHGGRWDVHGAPIRHTWAKLARPVGAGETTVVVREDVRDWPRDATVVITPTSVAPRDAEFEERHVASVRRQADGLHAVTLSAPLRYAHDGTPAAAGEVALLTRNVRITSKYLQRTKAHTMFMAGSAGQIAYAEFKELGTFGVLGRYPIHFHMMADSSRGMSVRGASIWRSGNHFMNVHGSNGIRIDDTVGYDAPGSGFFIETTQRAPAQVRPRTKGERSAEPSGPRLTPEERRAQKQRLKQEGNRQRKGAPTSSNVDIVLVHNLAAKGAWQPGSLDDPIRVALFWIASFNTTLIDNVAVGAAGRRNSSGFHLAERADRSFNASPLVMVRNEAHSNTDHGFFSWTNEKLSFDIVGFRAWRNGQTGMALGAYNHRFRVFAAALSDNGQANIAVWVSRPWIQDSILERSNVGLFFHPHPLAGDPGDPGLIVNTIFRGHSAADVSQDHRPCERPGEEQVATSRSCAPNYARFVRPEFHSSRTVDFGWHENAHSWIDLVDWPSRPGGLPAAFRLTRKDRITDGGQYSPMFDATVRPVQIPADLPPVVTLQVTSTSGRSHLRVQVRDDRGMAAVEFLADGVILKRLETAPYEMEWPTDMRLHRRAYVYARAVDTAGNVAYSQVVRLELPAP
jgi:hypothetical protein